MKRACQRLSTLIVIALLCVSTAASSEELTLRCKFEGSARPGPNREKEVNQIFIDTELPAVELRIAQTMGTSDAVYYGFRNREAKGMTADRILLYFLGSKMSMAAIRLGVPNSIVLDRVSGSMVWAMVDGSASQAYHFKCTP
jgi:hypothetical protein